MKGLKGREEEYIHAFIQVEIVLRSNQVKSFSVVIIVKKGYSKITAKSGGIK